MKRTLAYNRYPLVICTLGLLLGGLHSLFQLHQTPADTRTAAYLTAYGIDDEIIGVLEIPAMELIMPVFP